MLPALPIPEPLRGAETGTFAHDTVTRRLPEIGRRTLAEGNFPSGIITRLNNLIDEISSGRIRFLVDADAPDFTDWHSYVQPYEGQNWLEVPWFFAETYFYRRILEASGYYQDGPGHGIDPFAHQKSQGMTQARQALEPFDSELKPGNLPQSVDLKRLLHLDLWGNQADLSLWPAGGERETPSGSTEEHLLCDAVPAIVEHLQKHPGRLDIILDNTGAEFAFDLLLVDGLLRSGLVTVVRLWAKPHPTFVSDATQADITHALDDLSTHAGPGIRAMSVRLLESLDSGRLQIKTDYYWTSPLAGWEMPMALRQKLSGAKLVLSKGDANYRRWLGDRHWAYNTPLESVLAYAPASLGLLRVMKCEVAVGMREEDLSRLPVIDPEWMTDGKWGLIQFASGN